MTRSNFLKFILNTAVAGAIVMSTGCELEDDLFSDSDSDRNIEVADPTPPPASSSSGSSSSSGGSSTGYVWKPISEGDRNLVVLFPNSYKGKVNGGDIHSGLPPTDDNLVEKGRFSGDTHNGNRPHYRYSKPGSHYGKNLYSVAKLTAGGYKSWSIPNGANRYDY